MFNDRIDNELSKSIKFPTMSLNNILITSVDDSVNQHLSTRQVIKLTPSEMELIKNDTDLPFSARAKNNDIDFTNMTDAYMHSEYFSDNNTYVVSPEYAYYIGGMDRDSLVNIYNGSKLNTGISVIDDKINRITHSKGYNFDVPKSINYTLFNETKYTEDTRIGSYMYRFPTLSLNLPYEYYSKQYIPENIYTYDLELNKYVFAGKSESEFKTLFQNICKNGIRTHLFMQIRNGKIISASNDTYLIMLIATYLKIPYIPATIYMMNNTSTNGISVISRPIDIIRRKEISRCINEDDSKMKSLITKLTEPYFIFINKDNSDIVKSIDRSKYVPNKDVDITNTSSYDEIDLYKCDKRIADNDENDNMVVLSDEDVEKMHEEMAKKARLEMEEVIKNYLESLNNK